MVAPITVGNVAHSPQGFPVSSILPAVLIRIAGQNWSRGKGNTFGCVVIMFDNYVESRSVVPDVPGVLGARSYVRRRVTIPISIF